MTIDRVLPAVGLPPTGYPAGARLGWFFNDSPEGYRERKGHPFYGEHDIEYGLNSLGYRCPEFDGAGGIRVLAIGCSYVFGLGLAQGDLFHERFAARLRGEFAEEVVVWNLGMVGASNDYISRLLLLAVPRLDPHVVLINFTHNARREHISVENRAIGYNPSLLPAEPVVREIFSHLTALISPFDDRANFYRNYKVAELLLRDRCWLYSQSTPESAQFLTDHMDPRRYAGPLSAVDRARDGWHPGPERHSALAGLYWDRFLEIGGPESLVAAQSS